MSRHTAHIDRILDANLNRAKEGLRVCEEVCRFILEDARLTRGFKSIRHGLEAAIGGLASRDALLKERDSAGDVGKPILGNELKRGSVKDILYANLQRAKESIRVLEEFSKLRRTRAALAFKTLRYRLYDTEKKALAAFNAVRDH